MKVIIGSKNPTKINAVQALFPKDEIISINVPSKVSPQPFSDKETKTGAINRAKQCAEYIPNAVGIGLEGGVMYVEEELFLCNWGALVTPDNNIYIASGARILLPVAIQKQLKRGVELGNIMDSYAKKSGVSTREGAIGIFTNNLVTRKDMFKHVVTLLKGQWRHDR